MNTSRVADVLVVGGGPAGASAAWWLATQGHDVVVVERWEQPRDKTCGDAVSPRALAHLHAIGLTEALAVAHPHIGVRLMGYGREMLLDWPGVSAPTDERPTHGITIRRRDLDALVLDHARRAGATVLEGHEALAPIVERGFVRGALVERHGHGPLEVRARYVIVADGANSRFGRMLGTFRTREWPYATAIRSYWESPRHDEERLESIVDIADRDGRALPGMAWVFPLGDGTVNIGVGVLSTYREFRAVNTSHLLEGVVHSIADRWSIEPDRPIAAPTSGRIPMGGSVGPKAGPTFLVIGDAAASASPLTSDGLDGAYLTGRLAAASLHEALDAGDPTVLQHYPKAVSQALGRHFSIARGVARAIGRPTVMERTTRLAMRNRRLVGRALRAAVDVGRDQPASQTTVATSSSSRS